MINKVFKIENSGIEYTINIDKFEEMTNYIIEKELNLNPQYIELGIDSIHHETIFKITDEYRNTVIDKICHNESTTNVELVLKKNILNKLFENSNINEMLLYTPGYHPKARAVRFVVRK